MNYGLLVCAGKQSRFKSETPKALAVYNGKPLLYQNIENLSKFCDKIYVVCSFDNERYFDCPNKIVIHSGKGSGDAVWQALEKINIKKGDTCLVQWGDSLQQPILYKTLTENYEGITMIPCVLEESPYVQIVPSQNERVQVRFSKFNEEITPGFHDLSVIYCNAYDILLALRKFRTKILDKNGNYIHKHKNEMEFLDVFNEVDTKVKILEIENYRDISFNTLEQLAQLQRNEEK